MADIFLDFPLARDFIITNVSNQQFNLTTGSQNIPAGAVGNLRAFDIDFCELKYKYFYFPQVRAIFDDGLITVSPINGTSPLVCSWEPTTVTGGGGGTVVDSGFISAATGDGAFASLDDSLGVVSPLQKTVVSTPLVGGGFDKIVQISLNPQGLSQVGNLFLEDFAAVTSGATPLEIASITIPPSTSVVYDIRINAIGVVGDAAGLTAGMIRTIHVGSDNTGITALLMQSSFTHRAHNWTFTCSYAGSTLKWFVKGEDSNSVQWKITALKTILSV